MYKDLPTKIPIETLHRMDAEIHEETKESELTELRNILDESEEHTKLIDMNQRIDELEKQGFEQEKEELKNKDVRFN